MIKQKQLNNKLKKETPDSKLVVNDLKNSTTFSISNPIITYLGKFNEFFKKDKRILKSWEILFTPGDNKYFYIITSWILNINSYTKDGIKKEVGKAYEWYFIWEWVISWKTYKDVEAIAETEVEVYALNNKDLEEFQKKRPNEAIELYKHVIEITNERLINSWKELWTIYETTNKIAELSELWEKWFNNTITQVKNLLGFDYIIYIENHYVIDWLFSYKFNTNFPSVYPINKKTWNEINKNINWFFSWKMNILWVSENDSVYVLPLKNWEKLKWFFILWKKKWIITDIEIRIARNLSPILWYVVENNQKLAEEKAKQMKDNMY